jgi:hypothetical protein
MGEALNVFLRHSEGLGSASFFAFLLTALVLLGLWSGLGRLPLTDILRGPSARQLFLSVPMHWSAAAEVGSPASSKRPPSAIDFPGFVTVLSARKLSFISPRCLPNGARLTIDLGALPDFPETPGRFEIVVLRHRALTSKADSYLNEAAFVELGAQQKAPLLRFLQRLSGPSRLALG